jgi:hypothetical protein
VIVPTVYSKIMWAERRLTDFELADVLDLPGTLRKRSRPTQLGKIRNMAIPGKVVVALFELLNRLISHDVDMRGGVEVEADHRGVTRKAGATDLRVTDDLKKFRSS